MVNKKIAAGLALIAFSTPAVAGPNAFWMFGWDWKYNHGTGGLASVAKGGTARLQYASVETLVDDAPVPREIRDRIEADRLAISEISHGQ